MLNPVSVSGRIGKRGESDELRQLPALDPWILYAGLLLLATGLLMVTSASMPIADRNVGQPFYFGIRQGVYITIALLFAALTLQISLATWYRLGHPLLLVAFIGLISVLMPGVGKEVNGSMRWIDLGFLTLQVSEPAKLFVLVYVASYLDRHALTLRTSMMTMVRPLLVLAALALLLLIEPDFGSAVVLMATVLGMLFLAKVNLWRFATLQGFAVAAMALLLYSSDYRRERLIAFLDPWSDPFNSGFQLTQSLIAIGRGELFGVGLGASVQKLFYLPEAYTDFLFAILAEETGLLGVVTVIVLYTVIVWRAFGIAAQAERRRMKFAVHLAHGIGLWFAIQALTNIGVNMGVLPTKGLTLPLMSYGGSSLVVMCVALALLLRIDLETRPPQAELPVRQKPDKEANRQ